ncbi:aldehyde dehydrogenase [Amanita rubescens]|nr:aldehyde dehydrogenase [Amanita rubescens]KAF8345040.1 aldehyde dehydrogenase [Amanita rubescens]
MPSVFTHEFDTSVYKGKTQFNTGLFINGQFLDGSDNTYIDVVNPSTGQVITKISEGTAADVDLAVSAAEKAMETVWGLNTPGAQRGALLLKLAELIEQNKEELAALEALDNGKSYFSALLADIPTCTTVLRYFAGWADKIHGKTMETTEAKFAYTRHEPIGIVGAIIPWNFPLVTFLAKIAPALATGNAIVIKPSEITPLTAIRACEFIKAAGIPDGVVNVVTGYGPTVGEAIARHPRIDKVTFTGSVLTGKKIMQAAGATNLKKLTLELGGKNANIVFDDADLDQAVKWTSAALFFNNGQVCAAGTRIFVHARIYDEFLAKLTEAAKSFKQGDPFVNDTTQGPLRVMGYIKSGKDDGATVHCGGERLGKDGFFVQPTIFTGINPDMKIMREEIFGPVGAVVKFEDEEDIIKKANDTIYGLAAYVFSQNVTKAIESAHKLKAGSVWVNMGGLVSPSVPFGGYKQSGIGRELGQYALDEFTNVKAVHVNLRHRL